MNRKDIDTLLKQVVKLSKAKYCDGGLNYEFKLLPSDSDVNEESKNILKEFGCCGYELKKISEVSEKEYIETIHEFFSNLLNTKGVKYSQELINILNINFSPFTPYIWEADFQGYGYGLVLAIEGEIENSILLMDWTID